MNDLKSLETISRLKKKHRNMPTKEFADDMYREVIYPNTLTTGLWADYLTLNYRFIPIKEFHWQKKWNPIQGQHMYKFLYRTEGYPDVEWYFLSDDAPNRIKEIITEVFKKKLNYYETKVIDPERRCYQIDVFLNKDFVTREDYEKI